MAKKVATLLFFATTFSVYALEYIDLDRSLSRQKKENLLRELRIERMQGQALERLKEVETKKSIISSSTIPLKAQGVVGNALILPDGLVIHEGMNTSVGKVSVKNLKVGSFNLEPYGVVLGTGGPGSFPGQGSFTPPVGMPGTASPFPSLPSPPPPPPPPSPAPSSAAPTPSSSTSPTMQASPQAGAPAPTSPSSPAPSAPTPPPGNNPPSAPNPNPPTPTPRR